MKKPKQNNSMERVILRCFLHRDLNLGLQLPCANSQPLCHRHSISIFFIKASCHLLSVISAKLIGQLGAIIKTFNHSLVKSRPSFHFYDHQMIKRWPFRQKGISVLRCKLIEQKNSKLVIFTFNHFFIRGIKINEQIIHAAATFQ